MIATHQYLRHGRPQLQSLGMKWHKEHIPYIFCLPFSTVFQKNKLDNIPFD